MERILGQEDALAVIRAALRSGRVHHAWIFSGPQGVGKRTVAVELARVLLDPGAGPDLTGEIVANPESRASRMIDAGTHPDLHLIRKELALYSDNPELRKRKLMNIPLDLMREQMLGGRSGEKVHEAVAYWTPVEGHNKVFIIDEAELLRHPAQNALLKTLEEPPSDTFIVLVTCHPERLLPTIHSRCQHVRFRSLDEASMTTWLDRADLDVTPEVRAWITSFSEGSPGVATLAATYGFHQWREMLEPMLNELDRGRFPAQLGQTLASLVDSYATAWVKSTPNASKDAANKDGTLHVIRLLSARARRQLAETCARGDDPARPLGIIAGLRDAERHLHANVNLKQLLENLVAQWWAAGAVGAEA